MGKDVTGFGLLGHASEINQGAAKGMIFRASSVPVFPDALSFAEMGLVPGSTYRSRDFRIHQVDIDPKVLPYLMDILFDPQTSGWLLIAPPDEKAEGMARRLREKGWMKHLSLERL